MIAQIFAELKSAEFPLSAFDACYPDDTTNEIGIRLRKQLAEVAAVLNQRLVENSDAAYTFLVKSEYTNYEATTIRVGEKGFVLYNNGKVTRLDIDDVVAIHRTKQYKSTVVGNSGICFLLDTVDDKGIIPFSFSNSNARFTFTDSRGNSFEPVLTYHDFFIEADFSNLPMLRRSRPFYLGEDGCMNCKHLVGRSAKSIRLRACDVVNDRGIHRYYFRFNADNVETCEAQCEDFKPVEFL